MTLRWQPLRAEDAAAWATLAAEAEIVDVTGENYDAEDLAEELADSLVDLEDGSRAGWDGDVLAAVGLLRHSADPVPVDRVYFDGVVHPAYRRRGLGRELTRWAVRIAPQLSARRYPGSPVELHAGVHEKNTVKAALLEQEGFAVQRWFFGMQRPLDVELPVVAALDGVRIVPFDSDRHNEAARQVRNEAFADHWGSAQQTEQSWKQWFTGTRAFVAELSFVAVADCGDSVDNHAEDSDIEGGGEVVAILLSAFFAADEAVTGRREAWISTIGTLRAWRRRGLASALIATVLAEAKRQGYDRAALGVDADSPTGALGVYLRAGFEVDSRHARYVHPY
jgi:mycothiol synthase